MELTVYGRPIAPVSSFKYLGIILSVLDDDWTVVVRNIRWAHRKWAWLMRALGREGVYAWALGMFYIALVQAVLLYGSEAWVMYPHIGRNLDSFHHRVDLRLTGNQNHMGLDGMWV